MTNLKTFSVLLLGALALVLALTSAAVAADRQPRPAVIDQAERPEPSKSNPLEPCANLEYYCNATYYWSIPNDFGDDFFSQRFTPAGCCTLTTITMYLYDNYPEFSNNSGAGIQIHIWDDNGLGFPGAVQHIVNVPGPSLVFLPNALVVDVQAAGLIFCQDFHIGFTTVDQGVDNIAMLSDDGSCGTGRSSFLVFTGWGSMFDGYGIDVNFLISPLLCCEGEVCLATGDCDGDGTPLTSSDLGSLVAFISGGPAPVPLYTADFNGDCVVDLEDLILFQDYFTNGLSVFDPYGGYPVPTCCHLTHAQNFTFEQLDFYDENGVLVTPNSDWGHLSFFAAPAPGDPVLYLNVLALIDINGTPQWIVRNFPILPGEYMAPGRYGLDFDLGLLGVTPGTDVDTIRYGLTVGPTFEPTAPTIPIEITELSLTGTIQKFGGDVETGSPTYLGPGTLTPPYFTIEVDLDSTQKYKGLTDYTKVPSVQEGNDECASGATARSLKWLSNEHTLGMGTAQSIQERLDDADLMDQGANLEQMANAKKDYIEEKNLPLEVHYWYSDHLYGGHDDWHDTPDIPSVSSDSMDLLDWIWQEMKRGQDIEIFIHWDNTDKGHYVTLVGVDKKNKKFEYRDDENQGDTQAEQEDGDEEVKEAELSSLGDGEYGWKGADDRIIGAFAESPVETWISTTDPGTTRMPHAGEAPSDPQPWDPTRPGGTPMPGDAGQKVWIGKDNLHLPFLQKTWTIVLIGTNADKYTINATHGYIQGDPPTEIPSSTVTSDVTFPTNPKVRVITVSLKPQPDWEVIELERTDKLPANDTLQVFSASMCTWYSKGANSVSLNDARMGGPVDNLDVREVMLFADSAPISPSGLQTLETGSLWEYSVETIDPNGVTRPQGGVHWFLAEGDGIHAGDIFSITYEMDTAPDSLYDLFALNSATGNWDYYRLVVVDTEYVCGDADANAIVNISDAVYLIAYIFGGGPAPVPLLAGDADCNGIVNISDAVYLIAYIFGGGPAPCELCD